MLSTSLQWKTCTSSFFLFSVRTRIHYETQSEEIRPQPQLRKRTRPAANSLKAIDDASHTLSTGSVQEASVRPHVYIISTLMYKRAQLLGSIRPLTQRDIATCLCSWTRRKRRRFCKSVAVFLCVHQREIRTP